MKNIGDLSAVWQIILNNIREDHILPETAIDLWFKNFRLDSITAEKVVFASESKLKRDIIEEQYTSLLSDQIYGVIGFRLPVEIITDTSLADDPIPYDGTRSPLMRMKELRALKEEAAKKGTLIEDEEEADDEYEDEKDEISEIFDLIDDEEEDVPFAQSEAMAKSNTSSSKDGSAILFSDPQNKNTKPQASGERRLSFNTDYTFDNFIVGSSNKLAHAAAMSVADNPGYKTNPLFIYGPSGLGKTHLMYAIANRVLERDSTTKVIYVKGEEFMNQLIESIKVQKNAEFREKYRGTDMLLIDDIQFIAGKESTQQEFFHTFDALYEDHKQIIITSDRPPHELTTLEERIRSRFESGLLADIQPPDFELRLAILQNKADQHRLEVPTDVLTFLAERLQSNIRQIEGVIKKLAANHLLSGLPVTLDMVRSSVPEFIRENESVSDFVDTIIDCVARRFKVTSEDILGRKRNKEIKNARNICMYIIRSLTTLSLPKIGALFDRDYSTVHSNLAAVEKQLLTDAVLEAEINNLIREIKRM